MLPSILRQKTEEIAKQGVNTKPGGIEGSLVSPEEVIRADADSPYFYSLNHLSTLDVSKILTGETKLSTLKTDISQGGFGVLARSGAERGSTVYMKPATPDGGVIGGESTKNAISMSTDGVMVELQFMGTNTIHPLAFGLRRVNPAVMGKGYESSPAPVEEAKPALPNWFNKELGKLQNIPEVKKKGNTSNQTYTGYGDGWKKNTTGTDLKPTSSLRELLDPLSTIQSLGY